MSEYVQALATQVKHAREAAGVSQEDVALAIGVSQPTYSRIEQGSRPLKGDELILLADRLGVRVAAITGVLRVREQARFAARTDGTSSAMAAMRERLYAYLELDDYLRGIGLLPAQGPARTAVLTPQPVG
ncbi:helix-turn-helix domain-containing protein [Angustibacter sp. McL0619]|uniref:helix-turn-helix domain-containing protein n=1 Tax=Angustibacter sp. McL0619 TaxID=3415676 RepID=UPI003CF53F7B